MKVVFAISLIFAVVSAQEWKPRSKDELLAIRKACIEKSKLSTEDIENLKTSTYTDTMKPYIECFATVSGIWEDGSGFNIDRAVQQYKFDLPEDKVKEVLIKCIDENRKEGVSPFEYIIPVQKCIESSEIGEKIKEAIKE